MKNNYFWFFWTCSEVTGKKKTNNQPNKKTSNKHENERKLEEKLPFDCCSLLVVDVVPPLGEITDFSPD